MEHDRCFEHGTHLVVRLAAEVAERKHHIAASRHAVVWAIGQAVMLKIAQRLGPRLQPTNHALLGRRCNLEIPADPPHSIGHCVLFAVSGYARGLCAPPATSVAACDRYSTPRLTRKDMCRYTSVSFLSVRPIHALSMCAL